MSSKFTRLLFSSLLILLFNSACVTAESKKPHIVFILADDLGFGDLRSTSQDLARLCTELGSSQTRVLTS